MRILIKLGGTLLDNPDSLHRLTEEITGSSGEHEVVVVHGGGKQMTRFLTERGVKSRFVNGLRVTTPEIIDAVVKVFAGSINAQLVSAFRAAGAMPVGLTGLSAGLVDAVVLNPDLGLVGKPVHSDTRILELLVPAKYIPVIACVAGDAAGNVFNVNADQMAVACAASFRADKLLFLTDVDGVKGADGSVKAVLTASEAQELIRTGIATGGMQAKLESAINALASGVGEVLIAPGVFPGVVDLLIQSRQCGTRLVG